MTYGTSLGVALPTVGDELNWSGPLYATQVNACVQACIDRLEAKVTPAGIDITADVEFNGFLATELKGSQYNLQTDLDAATYPMATFFKGADGDFYVNDGAGNQIRLTSGGALDAAALAGITGSGYGSGGVEVAWYGAGNLYRLKDGSAATDFADLELATLRMASGTTGFFGVLAAPAGMVATKTWTLPAAYPASTSVWTVDTSGQLILSRALSIDTLALTSTLSVTGATTTAALTAAGLITASAGVTAAVDQHVTVSGTGLFKHGERTMYLPASAGSGATYTAISDGDVTLAAASTWSVPIPLEQGKRLIAIYWIFTGASTGSKALRLRQNLVTSATHSNVDSTSDSHSGVKNVTQTLGSPEVIQANRIYTAQFTAGNNGDIFHGVGYVYDQP